jgi:hypothetical protein
MQSGFFFFLVVQIRFWLFKHTFAKLWGKKKNSRHHSGCRHELALARHDFSWRSRMLYLVLWHALVRALTCCTLDYDWLYLGL